ncbi:hypothetical protein ASPZODRAFT_13083 [Penicilliopsis zonata CBS 506.65]|uniref:Uncharacterized protein n=1 Tax=Penicilliopsis zonata CBS 506.65 TaxID=1073090 RepID=A0A1L9SS02_9EURO|nr:hypothetical protein ASPZODRAFT_13083 [Penicilliopsis zonata CBS 506.65]OJJ49979.1 hypothetical protein ASPZODRAFT_13083 [Penicilliopsis zonata CBS 506.65]
MHFFLLFILLSPTLTAAIATARVWTTFYSTCPSDVFAEPGPVLPSSSPSPSSSSSSSSSSFLEPDANAELANPSTDIHRGTCESIATLPLDEDGTQAKYISLDAELIWSEPFDQCNVTIHELPGCVDPPLINRSFRSQYILSECVARTTTAYDTVWARLECREAGVEESHAENNNSTAKSGADGTTTATTATSPRTPTRVKTISSEVTQLEYINGIKHTIAGDVSILHAAEKGIHKFQSSSTGRRTRRTRRNRP